MKASSITLTVERWGLNHGQPVISVVLTGDKKAKETTPDELFKAITDRNTRTKAVKLSGESLLQNPADTIQLVRLLNDTFHTITVTMTDADYDDSLCREADTINLKIRDLENFSDENIKRILKRYDFKTAMFASITNENQLKILNELYAVLKKDKNLTPNIYLYTNEKTHLKVLNSVVEDGLPYRFMGELPTEAKKETAATKE